MTDTTSEKSGVHWFWWVLWLIVFWPAVIFVWMEHNKRKEQNKEQRKP